MSWREIADALIERENELGQTAASEEYARVI